MTIYTKKKRSSNDVSFGNDVEMMLSISFYVHIKQKKSKSQGIILKWSNSSKGEVNKMRFADDTLRRKFTVVLTMVIPACL